ncbi:MAG: hypothetical protein MI922_06510, partial [Bacteroidales bacterium]|nr:hypothetical protein [Bacteroidales bacterium]
MADKAESKIIVTDAEDSSKEVTTEVPKPTTLHEILLVPSTGECLFIDGKNYDLLQNGSDDNEQPYLIDKALENISGENQQEKLKEFNKILFGDEPDDYVALIHKDEYEQKAKFIEVISIKERTSLLVSHSFIEKIKEKDRNYALIIESVNSNTDDIFKDYRVTEENKKDGEEEGDLSLELDKKIRAAYLKKWHRRIANKEEKENYNSDGKTASENAKKLIDKVEFPKDIKEFIEGTKVNITGKWEKSVAVAEGKRDWCNKEEKKAIIELLKKNKFNQDDASVVLRSIRDLWGKKNPGDPSNEYTDFADNIKSDYDTKNLYEDKSKRKELRKKIEDQKVPPQVWNASVSGSVLRATAKASGSIKSDISKGELLKAEGKASAEAMLAEGKVKMGYYIPNDKGFHAHFHLKFREENITYEELEVNYSDEYPANFYFDSSFINAQTAIGIKQQLMAIASAKGSGDKVIGLDIVGHTDAVGTSSYNRELGLRRAMAAFDFIKRDYIGLSHMFQKREWGKDHVEYMQAVIHLSNQSQSMFLSERSAREIEMNLPTLREAMNDPEKLLQKPIQTITFEEHHYALKSNYEEYNSLCQKSIDDSNTLNLGDTKFKKNLCNGFNNSYVIKLIKTYHENLCREILDANVHQIIRYREGVISKGEDQLLVNTQNRSEANRRVELKAYILDEQRTWVKLREDIDMDFGFFRMHVEGTASGYAGATVNLSGSANLSCNPEDMLLKGVLSDKEMGKKKEAEAKYSNVEEDETNNKKQPQFEGPKAEIEAKAKAFAGVQAEAGLKSTLDWKAEEKEKSFKILGSVGYAITGSLGIGAEVEFKIGYDDKSGCFTIKACAKVTLGLGGGGKVEYSVGLGGLWALAKHVYGQIEKNKFAFIELFEDGIYEIYNSWYVKLLQKGLDIAGDAQNAIEGMAS